LSNAIALFHFSTQTQIFKKIALVPPIATIERLECKLFCLWKSTWKVATWHCENSLTSWPHSILVQYKGLVVNIRKLSVLYLPIVASRLGSRHQQHNNPWQAWFVPSTESKSQVNCLIINIDICMPLLFWLGSKKEHGKFG
jgi:hypothetical protein